jgi:hypothetical protein
MPFPKGVKPPGSGRKPGSRNKRNVEIERRVASTGKTPLEVMLECMRSYLKAGDLDKAVAFAKDAAPYIHPRMASVEVGGKPGAPPIETREVPSVELARELRSFWAKRTGAGGPRCVILAEAGIANCRGGVGRSLEEPVALRRATQDWQVRCSGYHGTGSQHCERVLHLTLLSLPRPVLARVTFSS